MNESENRPDDCKTDDAAQATDGAEREHDANRAFRADLNHKLRTPLNAILGYAELLALQPRGNDKDADVQQILRSARELLAVIERELGDKEGPNERAAEPAAPTRECDVLYIEDDPVNFTLVERILEYRPAVTVLHAPQGRRGLEMAAALVPKLILLDLNLPDMNGSEVLQRLQQKPSTAAIPVVILSANATPSQIERLLTAGARNYLTKPFNIDPFLAVVDEFTSA
ncbi:MAG TPA: response regulator [Chthoniobacterales bacterium]|nr:response regulator [Chthoniobacterales bacterium]